MKKNVLYLICFSINSSVISSFVQFKNGSLKISLPEDKQITDFALAKRSLANLIPMAIALLLISRICSNRKMAIEAKEKKLPIAIGNTVVFFSQDDIERKKRNRSAQKLFQLLQKTALTGIKYWAQISGICIAAMACILGLDRILERKFCDQEDMLAALEQQNAGLSAKVQELQEQLNQVSQKVLCIQAEVTT